MENGDVGFVGLAASLVLVVVALAFSLRLIVVFAAATIERRAPAVPRLFWIGLAPTARRPRAASRSLRAGVEPAVLVQLALMYLSLGGVVTTTVVTALGAVRRLFTTALPALAARHGLTA
jgi:ABC-type iron transport system FetAB permease component